VNLLCQSFNQTSCSVFRHSWTPLPDAWTLDLLCALSLRQRVWSLFTITGRMNCALSLTGRKMMNFILKFYL